MTRHAGRGRRGTALHVLPIGDLVECVSDDDCVCGPTANPIKADDGTDQWIMIRHGLGGWEPNKVDHRSDLEMKIISTKITRGDIHDHDLLGIGLV